MGRRFALALALAMVALLVPVAAQANGDPASDVLPFEDVFASGYALPTTEDLPPEQVARLKQVVREAKKSGFRIKVALIGKPGDLGLVTQLWQQPQRYADFLGQELGSFGNYHSRLLVVMPSGYGIYSHRDSTKAGRRLLDALPPAGTRDGLPLAASVAVQGLAKQQGTKLTLPELQQVPASDGGRSRDLVWIAAGMFTLLALVAVLFATRRWRSRR